MDQNKAHTVETQMLIRKPAAEVFKAFIDPELTKYFWFTKSDGKVEEGKKLNWTWEMYNVSAPVEIVKVIPNKLISFLWGEAQTTVEIHFNVISGGSTYVLIKNYGFKESGDELIELIKNNTGGFTTVLDGLKAYLEHGISLNLIEDKFPHLNQK